MDSLPHEIIEMICGYLPSQDLLQMTLVSHTVKWIVENSPSLMERVPLYLYDNDPDFCNVKLDDDYYNRLIEPLLESNKKVRKVIVKLRREKIIKYIGVFKKFSDFVRIMEIQNYAFDTLDQLRIILRYMFNVQKMTLINISFLKHENGFLNSIVKVPKYENLKNLKIIEVLNCDLRIFSLFTNNDTRLREIRLVTSIKKNDVAWRISYENFIEAVTHQPGLVKLSLDGINTDSESVFDPIKYLSCNLRYLEILNCKMEQRESAKNFIDMIKAQKYLKSLKIVKTSLSSSIESIGAYRDMFCNKYIVETSLDINESAMIHSHNFTISSIRKLTLRGSFAFENLPIFVNVTKMFPNTKQLKLEGGSPINEKYLHNILTTFRNLEELHIPGFTSRTGDSNFSILQSIENHGLKSLIMEYIDHDVKFFGWKNIITNLRSIKKLIIKRDYGKVSKEIVDMIVKTLKLKHLELGIGVVSDEIMKTIIHDSHCDELKVLKISSGDYDKLELNNNNFDKFVHLNQILFYVCEEQYFARKTA